jgi:bifunctional non-homologous end joining protein LigD
VAVDRLKTYRSKRDFTKTAEPAGALAEGAGAPVFVVQEHAARALHYDFRLEVDGVLASWAVPKGPSYNPREKRLAVHVEDHPLDYRDFEGGIPHGEYGGGRVIVWDEGTYRMLDDGKRPQPLVKAIERGHFSVWLEGTKLKGGWAFTRTAKPGDRQETWILVKRNDEFANPELDITKTAPESVKTGRTLDEVTSDDPSTWTRARATWVPPMLAELVRGAPADAENWVFERKFDGLRAIAVRNGDDVELWSRGHQSFNSRFKGIVAALGRLPVDNFTLDGEIVAYDGDRTSFTLLQSPGSTAKPVYEVFDVLHLLGTDTRERPLEERTALVNELVEAGPDLRPVERLTGKPDDLLRNACRDGWEGLIAKRADGPYRSGRSPDWRKLKCSASQELVIGGYTEPKGHRHYLGALLVGYYSDDGALHYAGKVGTGFNEATLEDLHSKLTKRERGDSPFADLSRLRDAHWARPDLVANIAFTEWTGEGKLRHPRFEGLRTDKKAREVRRERVVVPG